MRISYISARWDKKGEFHISASGEVEAPTYNHVISMVMSEEGFYPPFSKSTQGNTEGGYLFNIDPMHTLVMSDRGIEQCQRIIADFEV